MKQLRSGSASILAGTALACIWFAACASERNGTLHPAEAVSSLPDRIARGLMEKSPAADPSDAHARDDAGERLARFTELQDAIGEQILWGGFDPSKSYDPAEFKLSAFNSFVWSKLYLSTFMFTGPYFVHEEGPRTVLEVGARFRDRLDPGDFPYPFWHSAKKWQDYIDTQAVVLVFEGDHLVAGYRKVEHAADQPPMDKPWDGRWHWDDASGEPQPRASLYTYLLSPENPHLHSLDKAYRDLEARFRAQDCLTCHSPDNTAKVSKLYMLNYPNQALAGRHVLLSVLAKDSMPPLDPDTGHAAGLHDEAARAELQRLAAVFEAEGDAALSYEHAHVDLRR
jgi:hypothetical protein